MKKWVKPELVTLSEEDMKEMVAGACSGFCAPPHIARVPGGVSPN